MKPSAPLLAVLLLTCGAGLGHAQDLTTPGGASPKATSEKAKPESKPKAPDPAESRTGKDGAVLPSHPQKRWPAIVLDVLSPVTDNRCKELFSMMPQFTGRPLSPSDFEGARLDAFAGPPRIQPTIADIITKYGEADKVEPQKDKEGEFDRYWFDAIALVTRKGGQKVEFLLAPALWWTEGLRDKATKESSSTSHQTK